MIGVGERAGVDGMSVASLQDGDEELVHRPEIMQHASLGETDLSGNGSQGGSFAGTCAVEPQGDVKDLGSASNPLGVWSTSSRGFRRHCHGPNDRGKTRTACPWPTNEY